MQTIASGNYSGDLEDQLIGAAGRDAAYEEAQEGCECGATDPAQGTADYVQRSADTNARG